MSPRKSSAASGISPADGIPLEDFHVKKYRADWDDEDEDGDEDGNGEGNEDGDEDGSEGGDEDGDGDRDGDDGGGERSLLCSSPRSDDSRYTLYSEQIGYAPPQDHREMELYIAHIHGNRNREVVARIDHFIGPASKAEVVSLLKIEHLVEAALSNN